MKKILLTLLTATIAFTACKDEKADDILVMEVTDDNELNDGDNMETAAMVTREDAETMASDMKSNVTVDNDNNISITGFAEYGQLQNDIKNLSTSPNLRDKMNGEKAYASFETFVDRMPAYLKTNLVMKEVDDVKNAMDRFKAAQNNDDVTKATLKNRMVNVEEAVQDLNDEIVDVRLSLENDTTIDYDAYRDFVDNVNYDDEGYITIINFENYGTVQNDWMAMNEASNTEKDSYQKTLRTSFNEMVNRMPAYLKIDDVMDAVADVQKEMKEYEQEKNNVDTEENLENLEEIDEALYDLNKELIKSRKKYDDQKNDAIEEFMEEFNSNSNQTMQERVNDATEEYNEEMNR
ncbi:hypothetical protein SAMN05192588_2611 [Nonlabens sp. Hel1_33_55]|uniref:hypothetical protein n=1 Tax=Nonlabens sp. Hel1_33_55 TaxID=1336802 RepID=UPI000875B60F|nr:hypothetical protein [Nonlabens sp. Hel1_33_55]SCY38680.1 hypothetical protein SAMN05192588_2611 [Nonlabens sp. Hel1_33_55]